VGPGKHVLDGGARWHILANTAEPSVCGGNTGLLVLTYDRLYSTNVRETGQKSLHNSQRRTRVNSCLGLGSVELGMMFHCVVGRDVSDYCVKTDAGTERSSSVIAYVAAGK